MMNQKNNNNNNNSQKNKNKNLNKILQFNRKANKKLIKQKKN